MAAKDVNIVVTSYNRLESTKKCLESVRTTADVDYTLTVVDNNSTDGSREFLTQLHEAKIIDNLFICKYNVGVSLASNLGWACADTPYYVKLDNDVELLRPDWLSHLLYLSKNAPDGGTVGYYIENQRAESERGECFSVDRSVSSCILIPREVHNLPGFWKEDYGLYGMEDSDFGTRIMKAGLKNYYASYSERYIRDIHRIYLNNKNLDDQIRKIHGVSDESSTLFYFNNALFISGKGPVVVKRKFWERQMKDGLYEFFSD